MTVTQNIDFDSPMTEPQTTVMISESFGAAPVKRINATADTANLFAGLLCYLTGTTQANDMTEAPDIYGKTAQQINLYVVDIELYSPDYQNMNHHAPNTDFSGSLADYKKAENRPIKIIKLEVGMKLWVLISNDATGAATKGEWLTCAASGYVSRVGDPDGEALEEKAHVFEVLATVATQNWVPVIYKGIGLYDKTA